MQKSLWLFGPVFVIGAVILLIVLSLVKFNVDEQQAFLCEATSKAQLDMEECPAHDSSVSWMLFFAFGITFLLLGFGVYLLFLQKRGGWVDIKKEFKEINLSQLDADEKKIYEVLLQNQGSAYQGDLVKTTGFSKVKTTRILDKMAEKGILERKRRGMANLVVLK